MPGIERAAVKVVEDFARYIDDPYVEPGFVREPVQREMDVLLIGGGFGGLQAGAGTTWPAQ